jgi:hypothetical protein
MQDAIRTDRTRRGFAGFLRVPPRGVPSFSQQRPLLSHLWSLLFCLFSVPLLLLQLLRSLCALLFPSVSVRFGLAPLVSLLFHRADGQAPPKATLFPKCPAMSRSVWTAPYSGALASVARLRYLRLLLLQPSPLPRVSLPRLAASEPCESRLATPEHPSEGRSPAKAGPTFHISRFTFHASRGDQFVRKNRQTPARPANGKCLSISILHHESRGSCQVLWTQFPLPFKPQLPGSQHVTNAGTPLEFVRFRSDNLPPTSPSSPASTNANTWPSTQNARRNPVGLCPENGPDGGTNSNKHQP